MDFTVFDYDEKGACVGKSEVGAEAISADISALDDEEMGVDAPPPEGSDFEAQSGRTVKVHDPMSNVFGQRTGYISAQNGGQNEGGSCALIFNRIVATAAHVVLQPGLPTNTGSPIVVADPLGVEIFLGYPTRRDPATGLRPMLTGKKILIPTHYLRTQDPAFDFALVVTNESTAPYGQGLGLYTNGIGEDQHWVYSFGYPERVPGRPNTVNSLPDLYECKTLGQLAAHHAPLRQFCAGNVPVQEQRHCVSLNNRVFMSSNNLTKGASGGPVMAYYLKNKRWYFAGVNAQSFGRLNGVFSPVLSTWTWDMVNLAKSLR
ncbi:MAG: trypsin-like serine peptidase [Maritimibacter sp.]